MPDAETPQFRVSNEGEPIPPVDPEDLKRRWKIKLGDREALIAAQSQEANRASVDHRCQMIRVLTLQSHRQLLAPWKHGEDSDVFRPVDLDDAVFRVAATFPIRPLRQRVYKVPGDSMWGFDPNAFVEKLIEETGISHTWEPVLASVPEGSCPFVICRVSYSYGNQRPPDSEEALKKFIADGQSEQEAKHDARELLWAVWSKCQPNLSRSGNEEHLLALGVTMLFVDFVIDNIDLAREFVSSRHSSETRGQLAILSELEHRAQWLDLECPTCHRLLRDHSDDEMVKCFQALPPGSTCSRTP